MEMFVNVRTDLNFISFLAKFDEKIDATVQLQSGDS